MKPVGSLPGSIRQMRGLRDSPGSCPSSSSVRAHPRLSPLPRKPPVQLQTAAGAAAADWKRIPGASQSVVADARIARRLLRIGRGGHEQDRGNKNFIPCHDTFPFAGNFSARRGISSHKPRSSPSFVEERVSSHAASSSHSVAAIEPPARGVGLRSMARPDLRETPCPGIVYKVRKACVLLRAFAGSHLLAMSRGSPGHVHMPCSSARCACCPAGSSAWAPRT